MSSSISWDALEVPLEVSYNKIARELDSETERIVRGKNTFVSVGGKICRRPGTIKPYANSTLSVRVERAIFYETLDNPPVVYLVMSCFNPGTSLYEIWHQRLVNSPSAPVKSGTFRSIDKSTVPHEMVVARGLLYIKGFPGGGTGEKLGSVIFDGTAGTVNLYPWGILAPTTRPNISAAIFGLVSSGGVVGANMSATDTAFLGLDISTVLQNSCQSITAPPYVLQIDYEQINVTAGNCNVGALTVTNCTRGYNGTIATTHPSHSVMVYRSQGSGASSPPWTTSFDAFTVNQFWEYAYAIKSVTGQYSSRSPANLYGNSGQFNRTGPFFNQIPSIYVTGVADNVNFPKIAIYRTTDGGGTFYLLDEITNAGNGLPQNYFDQWSTNTLFTAAAGYPVTTTPVSDSVLSGFASTITSNSPPPSVIAPKVIGTDTPQRSTPMSYFQGRIWYAIGNVLFFSAQEEVLIGIPEETFPSGVLGNFFRLQHPITNIQATSDALYAFTLQHVYKFTGSDRQTFSYQPILDNFGHPFGHPRAMTRFGETVAFMTHDYRVILIEGDSPVDISYLLGTDLTAAITAGAEFDIRAFSDEEKDWLVITGHVTSDTSKSQQWVYDIKKSKMITSAGGFYSPRKFMWFTPWTYPSTCIAVGRISEASSRKKLWFFSWNGSNSTQISVMDPTIGTGGTATDATTASATATYDLDIVFNLMRNPSGNHVNAKRVPDITPVVYSLRLDRTLFQGDEDPQVYYFKDDFFTSPIPLPPAEDPPRRQLSTAYKTLEYPIQEVAQNVAFEISKTGNVDLFELQGMTVLYNPDAGA